MTKIVKYKFANGDKVRDTVTGYEGIVTCQSTWINGCIRYQVEAPVNPNTGVGPEQWLDEARLIQVKTPAVKVPMKKTGGDMRNDPKAF